LAAVRGRRTAPEDVKRLLDRGCAILLLRAGRVVKHAGHPHRKSVERRSRIRRDDGRGR
jgi:hypothetical protein